MPPRPPTLAEVLQLKCPTRRVPKLVIGPRTKKKCLLAPKPGETREATARRFVATLLDAIQVDEETTSEDPTRVIHSPDGGAHVLFRQQVRRLPVTHGWLRVDLSPEGRVTGYSNRLATRANVKKTPKVSPTISPVTAIHSAARAVGRKWALGPPDPRPRAGAAAGAAAWSNVEPASTPTLSLIRAGSAIRQCWVVDLKCPINPTERWRAYVDAHGTGDLLYVERSAQRASGQGRVFGPNASIGTVSHPAPNPIVALGVPALDPGLPDPGVPYLEVTFSDLDGSGYLNGPAVRTDATDAAVRVWRPDGNFRVTRGAPGFTEVMAYYHITAAAARLEQLGMKEALPHLVSDPSRGPVHVNVNGPGQSASSYYAPTRLLTLSGAGLPNGEDGEVILHEYGHAVQNTVVFGLGQDAGSEPVAEGFADYFAAAHFAAAKPPLFAHGIASWDAIGEGKVGVGGEPPFLRRLDFQSPTPSGTEIWAGCLWAIRQLFAGAPDRGDKAAIGSLWYTAPQAGMADAALAVVGANRYYNGGDNEAEIVGVFLGRGIDPRTGRTSIPIPGG